MDAIDSVFDPLREFAKDSVRLVKRCHKPDRKEFTKVAVRTAIGFVVMGFVGFFVKLIFIPINNIIVGSTLLHVTDSQEGQEPVEIFNTEIKELILLEQVSFGLNEFYVQANSVLDDNPMKYP
ncbi:hypothetical protein CXB51_003506 [Gossypium anomalum]|uniref:Protein transport protein Sec61 subunit gamma n=1 Tax=Gossypium anomalum TaxID=47600 RepID=A0A8J5ZPK3_9ROSI|nr:hypothetical protein CXB51_003506 [Gossypium anomalum]